MPLATGWMHLVGHMTAPHEGQHLKPAGHCVSLMQTAPASRMAHAPVCKIGLVA
jgi:hypothetical protein